MSNLDFINSFKLKYSLEDIGKTNKFILKPLRTPVNFRTYCVHESMRNK